MKKYILLGGLLLLSLSACGTERSSERAKVGQIGAESSVSREMAAKTIALAFYTNQELDEMETKLNFSDLSAEDWAYPYIQGCVEQGFFAGSEEGTFRPQADLTLWEAQALMDRLAPDYNSRIVLTAENKNMAVSYELWVQLLETVLKARRGEDSLYSYGIQTENAVVLDADGLCDTGRFTAAGIDLTPYAASRITFLEKDGEILALLTVEAASPVVKNIYCTLYLVPASFLLPDRGFSCRFESVLYQHVVGHGIEQEFEFLGCLSVTSVLQEKPGVSQAVGEVRLLVSDGIAVGSQCLWRTVDFIIAACHL